MLRVNTLFKYVSYHPLEHQIISTGTDRKIGFWETFDGALIRELDGSLTDSVNAVDVSDDGVYIVNGGSDKIIKVSLLLRVLCLYVCLSVLLRVCLDGLLANSVNAVVLSGGSDKIIKVSVSLELSLVSSDEKGDYVTTRSVRLSVCPSVCPSG